MLKKIGLLAISALTLIGCKTRQFGEVSDSDTLAPPTSSFVTEARAIWMTEKATQLVRIEKTMDIVASKANGDMSQIYRTIAVLAKSTDKGSLELANVIRRGMLSFMKTEQMQMDAARGLVKLSDRVKSDVTKLKGKVPQSELDLIAKLNTQRATNLKNVIKQISADYRAASLTDDAVNSLVAKVVFGDELLFNASQIAELGRLDPARAATARSLGERLNIHGMALDMASAKDFGVSREGMVAALGDDTGEAVGNLFMGTTSS